MKAYKKGKKYEITYRIPGYNKTYSERFDTEAQANVRIAQIQLEKEEGTLKPPTKKKKVVVPTISQLLDRYVSDYGILHWGDSYYSTAVHRIEDYIKPAIGDILITDITTQELDEFYLSLLKTPAVLLPGHKNTGKTVSYDVIDKCHCIMRSALNQAIKWGYISANPANSATPPKKPKKIRKVWEPADAQRAINLCDSALLKTAIILAIGCSMRIGEILGLQWKNVHITEENTFGRSSYLEVCQELKRCDTNALLSLEAAKKEDIFFKFPGVKDNPKTVLVLKAPKTTSSIRQIYISATVAKALLELKEAQSIQKEKMHGLYSDYDLVMAQPDGHPTEERFIAKAFKALCIDNGLPVVVFHSLRHLSISIKLQLSGGDIKAVQGDSGHAQSAMVTDVYSHTFTDNRKNIANLVENNFFNTQPLKKEADSKKEQVLNLLNGNSDLVDALLKLANAL